MEWPCSALFVSSRSFTTHREERENIYKRVMYSFASQLARGRSSSSRQTISERDFPSFNLRLGRASSFTFLNDDGHLLLGLVLPNS